MMSNHEAPINNNKKAILLVSFGSTYQEARERSLDCIAAKVAAEFPEFTVRQAFTSRTVVRRLKERHNIVIDTEVEALERLRQQGFQEVYVQPLHVVAGAEYDKIQRIVLRYVHAEDKPFARLALCRPLLYYMGQSDTVDDYTCLLAAMRSEWQASEPHEAVVLMGHGGLHPANAAYAVLQMKLQDAGLSDVFVYTLEGYPTLLDICGKLKQHGYTHVRLLPLMLLAGDHARNDMAGDDDESAKSVLQQAGFSLTDIVVRGLGEYPAVQQIYVEHIRQKMAQPPGCPLRRGGSR